MMTIEQAKQAVELSKEREYLIERANKIHAGDQLFFSATEKSKHWVPRQDQISLEIKEFAEEFRSLLIKELKAQVAKIDKKLRALGVEPDPFDAATPVKTKNDMDEGNPETPNQLIVNVLKPKPVKPQTVTIQMQKSK
jgi:hypothetical protein